MGHRKNNTKSIKESFLMMVNYKMENGHLSKRCRGSCQSSFAQGHPVSWDVQQQRRDAVADREQGRPEIGWLWKSVFGYKMPINFDKLSVKQLPVPEFSIRFHTECWSPRSQDDLTVGTVSVSFVFPEHFTPKSVSARWLKLHPTITLSDLSPRPFHRFPTRGDNDRPVAM